ncbi:uncharacterized protein LOC126260418 [Schistocerca nitens]|uniref:uncharacterized protein LOC126260418 n=1 Tax=Schistocerca nitens TaxID=7011 RepID=UPI002118A69B|nr:uncharacterized protein LOC126260418 [Schistocerca nitens]
MAFSRQAALDNGAPTPTAAAAKADPYQQRRGASISGALPRPQRARAAALARWPAIAARPPSTRLGTIGCDCLLTDDTARTYKTAEVSDTLECEDTERVVYPAYSTDLSPIYRAWDAMAAARVGSLGGLGSGASASRSRCRPRPQRWTLSRTAAAATATAAAASAKDAHPLTAQSGLATAQVLASSPVARSKYSRAPPTVNNSWFACPLSVKLVSSLPTPVLPVAAV